MGEAGRGEHAPHHGVERAVRGDRQGLRPAILRDVRRPGAEAEPYKHVQRKARAIPYVPGTAASPVARFPTSTPPGLATDWHNLFQTETSFMTFEGLQIQGAIKIMEKLTVSKVFFRNRFTVTIPIHIQYILREVSSFFRVYQKVLLQLVYSSC